MRHRALCVDCYAESKKAIVWTEGEIQSELIAVCRCPHGHVSIAGLMHDQFDVLYSSAVFAFLEAFYSESILSFTAALERAYEHYIKLYLAKQSMEFELIDRFWKEISSQSERQYGAFCLAYFATENQEWSSDQNHVSFRNKVIHKGVICDQNVARKYAEYITEKLNLIIKSIYGNFSAQKSPFYFHVKESAKGVVQRVMDENEGAKFVATGNPSFLKWDYGYYEEVTFDDAIQIATGLMKTYG